MAKKVIVDPITRIEGHLAIEVEIEDGKITHAQSAGEMFRGWEIILKGRDPRDAQMITQRICGVCPSAHAQASTLCLDDAFGVHPPDNGRLIRNLIFGANYIQSHVLHFYHLTALDYVDITAILQYKGTDPGLNKVKAWAKTEVDSGRLSAVAPFLPRLEGDYLLDTESNIAAIAHYLKALDIRKKAQEMLCVFGGRMPHEIAIMPGGVCERPTVDKIASYLYRLKEIQSFIDNVYIPDVVAVAKAYPHYWEIGKGCGNLLAYGVFEQGDDSNADKRLLRRGRKDNAAPLGHAEYHAPKEVNHKKIRESIKYSYYEYADPTQLWLHPWNGETTPRLNKASNPYSWVKAPRYKTSAGYKAYETGPLSRMVVNGDYYAGVLHDVGFTATPQYGDPGPDLTPSGGPDLSGIAYNGDSTLDRIAARALEAKKIVDALDAWLNELETSYKGAVTSKTRPIPTGVVTKGVGMTEAPRGALGHWIKIRENGKIKSYQCIVPSTWNTSPKCKKGIPGPAEKSLLGTHVKDAANPLEILRVAHSFDFCTACAVHLLKPKSRGRKEEKIITLNPTH